MWKIVVGFIVFAALALYVISKGGDSLDMSGEKHGTESHAPAEAAASATAGAASAAPVAASAASQ
ncbi:hypothetical protein [Ideonella livida]|uniref:Uncharacterized protein n=1 Tax=Ideonella livida TaxID=2707176 RepID=A0A7C9TN35_9BURK|nr:hypothetical protein [Ideonella livida]NDY93105.1 hypothetical protein [Ideonella livida]